MHSYRFACAAGLAAWLAAAACSGGGDDDGTSGGGGGGGGGGPTALIVDGDVVDFVTGEPIAGQATVSTRGLDPAPEVTVDGASFELSGVPGNSVFQILAGSPPDYRSTYAATVTVDDGDVTGVAATVLSEEYVAKLADAFGVADDGSLVLVQATDGDGAPRAGVPASAFVIDQAAGLEGPFFLDADLAPAPDLKATSDSGWVIFFHVDPGLVTVTAAVDSGYTMEMPASPVDDRVATVAAVKVTDGEVVLPANVSFENDVVPIFERRGCQSCHSGSGPGRDLGDLTLDGSTNLIYKELVEEVPDRVVVADPPSSLVLTYPSAEDPPDSHPNVTFTGPTDPDYLLLLVWIQEGAKPN
jgi:hypothetical protein